MIRPHKHGSSFVESSVPLLSLIIFLFAVSYRRKQWNFIIQIIKCATFWLISPKIIILYTNFLAAIPLLFQLIDLDTKSKRPCYEYEGIVCWSFGIKLGLWQMPTVITTNYLTIMINEFNKFSDIRSLCSIMVR